MTSVVVIRRRPKSRFPHTLVNRTADVLGWSPEAAERSLTGAGWSWVPGARDSVAAARLAEKLGDLGVQCGALHAAEAGDLAELRAYARTAAEGEALKLLAENGALELSKTNPGGAVLLGLRWDGKTVRRFDYGAKRPGIIVWGRAGPLGVVWLREGKDEAGLTAAELALLLEQAVARRALLVVDDSYIPDDLPAPNARFREAWAGAGGDAGDVRALLHAVMIRAFQRAGVLRAQADKSFDPSAPVTTYAIVKRDRLRLRADRLFAWAAAGVFVLALRLAPESAFTTVAGAVAGLAAVAHAVRIFGRWLRLSTRPLSKIRSMAMGPVHLSGEIQEAMKLVSPMRGVSCVYYRHKHERRGPKGGWKTVRDLESPLVPFYLKDATGKVLVDSLDAEWNGLERYEHKINHGERIREWVLASGVHADVYGFAHADPEAPVIVQQREGLSAFFMTTAAHFDVNHDGVINDAERVVALQALENHIKADRTNVSMQSGVYVSEMRREPIVISTRRALPLGLSSAAAVALWLAAALGMFLAVFVYRELAASLAAVILSERWLL